MARVNQSLTGKIMTPFDNAVFNAYSDLEGLYACAGLKNATENYNGKTMAQIAAINHFGAIVTKGDKTFMIPPRDFVSAYAREGEYLKAIREIIQQNFQEAVLRHRKKSTIEYSKGGGEDVTDTIDVQTRPMGGGEGRQHGPFRTIQRIAVQMAENQRNAIKAHDFPSGASHNAEATRENKGFDYPLVQSGAMLGKVKGWVEYSDGDNAKGENL